MKKYVFLALLVSSTALADMPLPESPPIQKGCLELGNLAVSSAYNKHQVQGMQTIKDFLSKVTASDEPDWLKATNFWAVQVGLENADKTPFEAGNIVYLECMQHVNTKPS